MAAETLTIPQEEIEKEILVKPETQNDFLDEKLSGTGTAGSGAEEFLDIARSSYGEGEWKIKYLPNDSFQQKLDAQNRDVKYKDVKYNQESSARKFAEENGSAERFEKFFVALESKGTAVVEERIDKETLSLAIHKKEPNGSIRTAIVSRKLEFKYNSLEEVVNDLGPKGKEWVEVKVSDGDLMLNKNSMGGKSKNGENEQKWNALRIQGWFQVVETNPKTGKTTQKIYFANDKGEIGYKVFELLTEEEYLSDEGDYDLIDDDSDDDEQKKLKRGATSSTLINLDGFLDSPAQPNLKVIENNAWADFWDSLIKPPSEEPQARLEPMNSFNLLPPPNKVQEDLKPTGLPQTLELPHQIKPALESGITLTIIESSARFSEQRKEVEQQESLSPTQRLEQLQILQKQSAVTTKEDAPIIIEQPQSEKATEVVRGEEILTITKHEPRDVQAPTEIVNEPAIQTKAFDIDSGAQAEPEQTITGLITTENNPIRLEQQPEASADAQAPEPMPVTKNDAVVPVPVKIPAELIALKIELPSDKPVEDSTTDKQAESQIITIQDNQPAREKPAEAIVTEIMDSRTIVETPKSISAHAKIPEARQPAEIPLVDVLKESEELIVLEKPVITVKPETVKSLKIEVSALAKTVEKREQSDSAVQNNKSQRIEKIITSQPFKQESIIPEDQKTNSLARQEARPIKAEQAGNEETNANLQRVVEILDRITPRPEVSKPVMLKVGANQPIRKITIEANQRPNQPVSTVRQRATQTPNRLIYLPNTERRILPSLKPQTARKLQSNDDSPLTQAQKTSYQIAA